MKLHIHKETEETVLGLRDHSLIISYTLLLTLRYFLWELCQPSSLKFSLCICSSVWKELRGSFKNRYTETNKKKLCLGKDNPCSWIKKSVLLKCLLARTINRFSTIHIKTLISFLHKLRKKIQKFIWNHKSFKRAKAILSKKKSNWDSHNAWFTAW